MLLAATLLSPMAGAYEDASRWQPASVCDSLGLGADGWSEFACGANEPDGVDDHVLDFKGATALSTSHDGAGRNCCRLDQAFDVARRCRSSGKRVLVEIPETPAGRTYPLSCSIAPAGHSTGPGANAAHLAVRFGRDAEVAFEVVPSAWRGLHAIALQSAPSIEAGLGTHQSGPPRPGEPWHDSRFISDTGEPLRVFFDLRNTAGSTFSGKLHLRGPRAIDPLARVVGLSASNTGSDSGSGGAPWQLAFGEVTIQGVAVGVYGTPEFRRPADHHTDMFQVDRFEALRIREVQHGLVIGAHHFDGVHIGHLELGPQADASFVHVGIWAVDSLVLHADAAHWPHAADGHTELVLTKGSLFAHRLKVFGGGGPKATSVITLGAEGQLRANNVLDTSGAGALVRMDAPRAGAVGLEATSGTAQLCLVPTGSEADAAVELGGSPSSRRQVAVLTEGSAAPRVVGARPQDRVACGVSQRCSGSERDWVWMAGPEVREEVCR